MYIVDEKIVNESTTAGVTVKVNGIPLKDFKFNEVSLKDIFKDKVLKSEADKILTRLKLAETLIYKVDIAAESLTNENSKLKVEVMNLNGKISTLTIDNDSLTKRLDDANLKINELTTVTLDEEVCSEDFETKYKEEKDKYNLTLNLLNDAQEEIKSLKTQIEKLLETPVVEEATCKKDYETSVDEPIAVKPEVETVEDEKSKIRNFIRSLSIMEKDSLKKAIKDGHKNDQRLSSTIRNWELKIKDKDDQLVAMFKTALARRRGKILLKSWYERFDKFSK